MYDITDRHSFTEVQTWMNEIAENCPESVAKVLVGNKADFKNQRTVGCDEAFELADEYCIRYFETSAKDSENVEITFSSLVRETVNSLFPDRNRQTKAHIKPIRLFSAPESGRGLCC